MDANLTWHLYSPSERGCLSLHSALSNLKGYYCPTRWVVLLELYRQCRSTAVHTRFIKPPATNETKVNIQCSFLCTELCTVVMLTVFFVNHSASCWDCIVPVEMKDITNPKTRMNTALVHAEGGQRVCIRKTLP